jgi:hypothetical protein
MLAEVLAKVNASVSGSACKSYSEVSGLSISGLAKIKFSGLAVKKLTNKFNGLAFNGLSKN